VNASVGRSEHASPSVRDNLVVKDERGLHVPNAIYAFMQRPAFLWVAKRSDGLLIERKFDGSTARTIGHNLLRRRHGWSTIWLDSADRVAATFKDRGDRIPHGLYELIDYYPMFQLFPVSPNGEAEPEIERATLNAATWATITEYHEHLGLADQNSVSHEVSKMMAATVGRLAPHPERILELGCGAGRNLYWMSQAFPDAEIVGVDINPSASVRDFLPTNVRFIQQNVLELDFAALGRFDAIFTCGFLMHINHQDVRSLIRAIEKHSDVSLHFELHGPANTWDFHRYPRNYDALYDELGLPFDSYAVFAGDEVYSHDLGGPFAHALLESSHR
jgi:SAM-dependent methyltransferase